MGEQQFVFEEDCLSERMKFVGSGERTSRTLQDDDIRFLVLFQCNWKLGECRTSMGIGRLYKERDETNDYTA